MDNTKYQKRLEEKNDHFESICRKCAACCGAGDGDPCSDLEKDKNGSYYCTTYNSRFGERKTISGRPFNCVSIREHIRKGTVPPGCGYSR